MLRSWSWSWSARTLTDCQRASFQSSRDVCCWLAQEHASLVSAAAAGAAKDLTGLLGGGGSSSSGSSSAAGTDPNVQWYLKKAEVADAWSLTEGGYCTSKTKWIR